MSTWSAFWLGFAVASALIAAAIVWYDSLPITEVEYND